MIQDRHVPVLVSLNSISGTVAPVIEDLRQVGTIPDAGKGHGSAVLIDLKPVGHIHETLGFPVRSQTNRPRLACP